MQRGRISLWLCFVLAFVVAIGIAWFVARPPKPIGERVVLSDGTELTLHAITFGKEHSAILGKPWEIMLDRVPEKFLTKWKWVQTWRARLQKSRMTFSEDKLVLWFAGVFSTNNAAQQGMQRGGGGGFGGGGSGGPTGPPRINGVPWRIAGPNGSEQGGLLQKGLPTGMPLRLYPVEIESYPRRLPEFTFKVYQPVGPETVPGVETLAKAFVIRNPKMNHAATWIPAELPARADVAGLSCVLGEFQVVLENPEAAISKMAARSPEPPEFVRSRMARSFNQYFMAGASAHCRIVFELFEKDAPATNWMVRTLMLHDAAGNAISGGEIPRRGNSGGFGSSGSSGGGWTTRISSIAAGGTASFLATLTEGNRITCLSTPLWLDEPAWKFQIELVQIRNFPSQSTVRLGGIPFPPEPGTRQLTYETNLFGRPVKIYSIGSGPALAFEFDPKTGTNDGVSFQSVKVVEVVDDAGQRIMATSLRPDGGSNPQDNWRLDFMDPSLRGMVPNLPGRPRREIKSIDITLALPEQRTFEFTVKPTWVNAEENTNEPAKNR